MSADLRARALEHVEHARRDYPSLRDVDLEVFVAAVERHLEPLAPDRPFRRPRLRGRRGEPSWIGGAVGLHVPRAREGEQ